VPLPPPPPPPLPAPNRHLVQRYFGLGGVAAASIRHLAAETHLTRTENRTVGRL
jgi:hypothetical protein